MSEITFFGYYQETKGDDMFTVEKNIPLGPRGKYPEAEKAIVSIDVGDSFLFPSESIPSSLYKVATNANRKITIRKAGDGQYRIWRTA